MTDWCDFLSNYSQRRDQFVLPSCSVKSVWKFSILVWQAIFRTREQGQWKLYPGPGQVNHIGGAFGNWHIHSRKMPQMGLGSMQGSTEGRLPPKVVFHRRLSSTKDCLPPKVVFHQRLSSINHNKLVDLIFVRTVNIPNLSLLPCLEMVYHKRSSSTYHNTLVDLIFVRTVNIPNLSLLPCLEMVFHQRSSSTEGRLPQKIVFHLP